MTQDLDGCRLAKPGSAKAQRCSRSHSKSSVYPESFAFEERSIRVPNEKEGVVIISMLFKAIGLEELSKGLSANRREWV